MPPPQGVDEHAGASLHQIQATGAFQRYLAVAAGGGGAEATARLASDDPINRVSSARGHGAWGGEDVEGVTGAVVGREGGSRRRHRRPLSPEHRVALKRAVSALWEPSIDGGGGGGGGPRDGSSGGGAGAGDDEERRDGEQMHGGLRASELSAAIYGMQQRDASRHEYGGHSNSGREIHRDAGDSETDAEEEGERAWDHRFGCSREDFEEILAELESEEKKDT